MLAIAASSMCALRLRIKREEKGDTEKGEGGGPPLIGGEAPRVDPCLTDFPFISGIRVFGTHITNSRIKLVKTGFQVIRRSGGGL